MQREARFGHSEESLLLATKLVGKGQVCVCVCETGSVFPLWGEGGMRKQYSGEAV